jgi:glycosyltransferase involved in cell wall biosynthesis
MTEPLISVVVETVSVRFDYKFAGSLADALRGTLTALEHQTIPRENFEVIVVIDDAVDPTAVEELRRAHPGVRIAHAAEVNYFAAKNAGAAVARGSIIALIDGDCEAAPDWLERLASRFDASVNVVVGRTRYAGGSLFARTFSVSDFAGVLENDSGGASGFNLSNVALRAETLRGHPIDARLRRNGGCYLLYHQLLANGVVIAYEPRARVGHGLDIRGLGFAKKHFERGFDGIGVYRLDDRGVLRGTRFLRRFGGLAMFPIMARRIAIDWVRLARHRRQIGISLVTLPYYGAVVFFTRSIELVGALVAVIGPNRYRRPATGQ